MYRFQEMQVCPVQIPIENIGQYLKDSDLRSEGVCRFVFTDKGSTGALAIGKIGNFLLGFGGSSWVFFMENMFK